ncbi:hypothetical protein DFQ26_007066 [Actinomortierella ambigua]|nr:hypothetical protein DFQ26_007066 [Actinomortierella ambigua]
MALPGIRIESTDPQEAPGLINTAITDERRALIHSRVLGNQYLQKRQELIGLTPKETTATEELSSIEKPVKAKKDKKKKKKKKKKNQRWGPPGTRDVRFKGPLINPASFPGLVLQPIQSPWRHSIVYEIDWSFDPSTLEEFMYAHLPDSDGTRERISPQGPYTIDVKLFPLEPGKNVEPLLINVPLTTPEAPNVAQKGTLKIPLRSDIPVDWYRLDIQIWDMGYRHQPDESEITPAEIEALDWKKSKEAAAAAAAAADEPVDSELEAGNADLDVSLQRTFWSIASWIVSGPGQPRRQRGTTPNVSERREDMTTQSERKNTRFVNNGFYNKRRVAAWRGTDVILVTTLPQDTPEWSEFMRNSREDLQEKLESKYADDPAELARKLELAHLETVEYLEAAKEYRMPRPQMRFVKQADGSFDERPGDWDEKKDVVEPSTRVPPPDPVLDEDDLEEIEAAKPEAEKEKERRDRQHLEHWLEGWFGPATSEADNSFEKEDGLASAPLIIRDDQETSSDAAETIRGAGQLNIQVEYMNRVLSHHRLFTVPANADRVVSWQTPDGLVADKVIFSLELIQLPPEHIITKIPEQIPERIQDRMRPDLLRKALDVPHTALIIDRIPGSWGAISVRIPSYVSQGPYQFRLHGTSKDGRQWADVSQPFMVLNDPFIYSYPPF